MISVPNHRPCLLCGATQLTPISLEHSMLKLGLLRKRDEWSEPAMASGFVVDLSEIEWVDFGATAQLVLLIHKAAAFGLPVDVHLPDKRDSQGNQDLGEHATARVAASRTAKRIRAYGFLRYLRFPEAIRFNAGSASWKMPEIFAGEASFDPALAGSDAPDRYTEKLAPLTWINHAKSDGQETFAKFLSKVIGRTNIGLPSSDASALAGVIVHELVENAFKHSGDTGLALVSAWARPHGMIIPLDGYFRPEQDVLRAASEKDMAVVELFVGDSGLGISETLKEAYVTAHERQPTKRRGKPNPAEVVDWAFDRWSSRTEVDIATRGVRGLYRVDRQASRYQGLLCIQTHRTLRYRSHFSDFEPEIFSLEDTRSYSPGTSLRLRLFINQPGQRADPIHWKLPSTFQYDDGRDPLDLMNVGKLTEEGLTGEFRTEVQKRLLSKAQNPTSPLYVLVSGNRYVKHQIEQALLYFTSVSAPRLLVVVGLPGTDIELQSSAQSVTEVGFHSKSILLHETTTVDPVLIISSTATPIWTGVTPLQGKLYNLVIANAHLEQEKAIQLLRQERDIQPAEWLELERSLREHKYLLKGWNPAVDPANPGKRILRLGVDLRALVAGVRDEVLRPLIEASKSKKVDRRVEGSTFNWEIPGLAVGPFLSPSLQAVSIWLKLEDYLKGPRLTIEPSQVITALSYKIRLEGFPRQRLSAVLSDGSATKVFRDIFAACLDVSNIIDAQSQDVDEEIPASYTENRPRVIVFADLIASSETAKRTIVYAMRHGYIVEAVACVFDTRADPTIPIRVWSVDVPVLSLAQIATELNPCPEQVTIVSPFNRLESPADAQEYRSISLDNELTYKGIFAPSHVSRPNGRHLTFIVQPTALLQQQKMRLRLQKAIEEWLYHLESEGVGRADSAVVIWTPMEDGQVDEWIALTSGALGPGCGTRRFTVEPFRKFSASDRVEFIGGSSCRTKHVIIFDWGLVTGSTMMRLARRAVEERCLSILALSVISQMPADEEQFLSSVSRLSVEVPGDPIDLLTPPERIPSVAPTRFQWLESYTLGHFMGSNCPVCLQRAAIIASHPRTAFLEEFRREEIRRLSPRSMDVAIEELSSGYKKYGDIDPGHVSNFRRKFLLAGSSTSARRLLAEELSRNSL